MGTLAIRYSLELAVAVPAAVFALLPVLDHLRYRTRVVWGLAGVMLLCMIIPGGILCARLGINSNYVLYPSLVCFFTAYCWAVDLSISKKLFCFCNAVMFDKFCTIYTLLLMAPLENNEAGPFLPVSGLVCLALASLMGAVFFRSLTVKLPMLLQEKYLDNIWWVLCILLVGFIGLLYWMSPDDILYMVTEGRIREICLVLFIFIPLMIFILYHVSWQSAKQISYSSDLRQENFLLQQEHKRYRQFRNYIDKTRTLRHDFRQHLLVIEKISREGDIHKLQQYLQEIREYAGESPEQYCANSAVDAIVSYYANQAAEKQIKVDWQLELPDILPVKESDYCGLMGNLLENALRATEKLPSEQRHITVVSRMLSKEMLGLTVENPYEGKIRMGENGLPRSRRKLGGIGLPSVAATVQKYHGTLDIRTKKGLFRVGILLYSLN